MSIPLSPLGGIALGTFAWNALRELSPGAFLQELWKDEPATSGTAAEAAAAQTENRSAKPLHAVMSEWTQKFLDRLRAAGVSPNQPFVLKDDGFGRVVIHGAHPDRDPIENVLNSDPELRDGFLALAAAAQQERDAWAEWGGPAFGEFRLEITGESARGYFE